MSRDRTGKLALLWPRDAEKWHAANPRDYRLSRVFDAMAALGIEAEPALYADDAADQVREQLLRCDGVLVWVDPLSQGRDRLKLDALLRDVASNGVWVSTHPDVILKMGVKEVLYRTRHLGWGTDTHLYRNAGAFRDAFPQRLFADRAAGAQTEPRQWRRRRMEGRACLRIHPRRRNRSGAARAARQRAAADAARRFHGAVRALFRQQRLHRRSAVPGPAARRHDPLLHGRRQGRRLRTSADQGADPAAARRPGLRKRPNRARASCIRPRHRSFRRSGQKWSPSGRPR